MIDLRNEFEGKKVLITGGLGFIGSNLAFKLAELDARITVVDPMIPGCGGNKRNFDGINYNIDVKDFDMRNFDLINEAVQKQDYIFNLAGILSHVDSMKDPFTDLEINCKSQLCLLEACRRSNTDAKIVFAGTRGQYGKVRRLPVSEKQPMRPIDINGINNAAGEKYHILYNNVYGIRTTSLRMTNVYGPRHQMQHSRQGVVNWFMRQLMDEETIRLYGDGSQIRDLNYVDDVCNALLLAMASGKTNGRAYNIGGEAFSLKEIVEIMIKVYGTGEYKLIPFPADAKKIEIGDYVADSSKFRKATGWMVKVPIQEGFKKTFEYYKKYKGKYW